MAPTPRRFPARGQSRRGFSEIAADGGRRARPDMGPVGSGGRSTHVGVQSAVEPCAAPIHGGMFRGQHSQ